MYKPGFFEATELLEMEKGVWTGDYQPSCLKQWHGLSDHFTSAISSFYADNSLSKSLHQRTHSTTVHFHLLRSHLITKARIERLKLQRESIQTHNLHLQQIRTAHQNLAAASHTFTLAVLCVQRHVRGWLCRIHYSQVLIERGKETVQRQVESLDEFARWMYVSTEREVMCKVALIQKAYRRYRRLKMIEVLAKAYAVLMEWEARASSLLITTCFRRFLAYKQVKTAQFAINRDLKLREIRRKLAILRISSIWKSLGITLKGLKSKLRRAYRRQRRARSKVRTGSPKRSLGHMDFDSGSYSSIKDTSMASGTADELSDPLNRSSFQSNMLLDCGLWRWRKRQEEVRTTMQALGFVRPKEVSFTPVMENRRGDSPVLWRTETSGVARLLATTEAANERCRSSQSKRTGTEEWRRTVTATPQVREVQGKRVVRTGRYMDPTESFTNWHDKGAEEQVKRRWPGYWKPRGKVLLQTVAWASKRRPKSQRPASTCSWRPFASSVEPEYIPSLDNSTYLSKQFQARPYHRALPRPQTSANEPRPQVLSSLESSALLSSAFPPPLLLSDPFSSL